MKKLTLKWIFFLIINYIQLVIVFFSLIGAIISITQTKNDWKENVALSFCIAVFLWIMLNCILNIYIVNRFFPDNLLSGKTGKFLRISSIAMIVISVLLGISIGMGFIAMFEKSERADFLDVAAFVYLGIVFLFCLSTTILQFQIPRYLQARNTGNINKLIDSIGK